MKVGESVVWGGWGKNVFGENMGWFYLLLWWSLQYKTHPSTIPVCQHDPNGYREIIYCYSSF